MSLINAVRLSGAAQQQEALRRKLEAMENKLIVGGKLMDKAAKQESELRRTEVNGPAPAGWDCIRLCGVVSRGAILLMRHRATAPVRWRWRSSAGRSCRWRGSWRRRRTRT